MIEGLEVIDAHMHIFTKKFTDRINERIEKGSAEYQEAFHIWSNWFKSKYNSELSEQNEDPPAQIAKDWLLELDKYKIDKACFIALHPEEDELTEFISASDGRFYGFATVDPRDKNAPALLKKRINDENYVGLKLYPTLQRYKVSDKSLYPVYETAASLGIPIMLHMGITLSYEADLRYANPIELHPVIKSFPKINFIVPHFGAGYFKEILFLAYHVQNFYVDTSGNNVWTKYLPYKISLEDVMKKTIDIMGPERIIYGSDSRMLSRGYRARVLEKQLSILKNSGLNRDEIQLIMGGNLRRLISR